MLEIIALAVQRCPKLSNLIIEGPTLNSNDPKEHGKQERLFQGLDLATAERADYARCLRPMLFCIWDILEPFHRVDRELSSLIMLDRSLTCSRDCNIPTTTIFRNLKHLRYCDRSSQFLASIVACAPKLESIGIVGALGDSRTSSLRSLLGGSVLENLRACSLENLWFDQEDLIQFLLRHSVALQHLRLTNVSIASQMGWAVFANRMRGRLPEIRRVELSKLRQRALHYWHYCPTTKGADLLQDPTSELETGPMEIEDGLWEDYEGLFFPEKCRS